VADVCEPFALKHCQHARNSAIGYIRPSHT
jgi:hypothetical protein